MLSPMPPRKFLSHCINLVLLLVLGGTVNAQSSSSLQGYVTDLNGAVVLNASITATNVETSTERKAQTGANGMYQFAALAVGTYQVQVSATGFRTEVAENVRVTVARTITRNFQLTLGQVSEKVTVGAEIDAIDRASVSFGQSFSEAAVQNTPLNGRHFVDLGTLIPGSVTPPQNGVLTAPTRGQGPFSFNSAGAREDTVNFQINGINLNDLAFNVITVAPSITTIREFKVDNSTITADIGRSSGSVVNIATRSGTNEFHGELFHYLRNDALDARNFFNFTSPNPPPFKRNQFGGALGGPIVRGRLFFYFAYEGVRQRQGLDLNSLVLSDAQRAGVTDPVVRNLVDLIPRANFIDSTGNARFIGSATAPVDLDQYSLDISYNLNENDWIHGYYSIQNDKRGEPTLQGNTIPGFGDVRKGLRQVFTFSETHTFNPNVINEARFGFNRIFVTFDPVGKYNPADFGIQNGINEELALPQINVAGGLNFGGPLNFPQGRGDTTFVVSDTLNYSRGKHQFKFGGEFRRFLNNNFTRDPGSFNFPNMAAFLNGIANAFSITLGDRASSISQGALGAFARDTYRWRQNLSFELGFRYEWNMSPTERYDRFVVFDPDTASLLRVGTDIDQPYRTNSANFEPRVGLAWDPFKDGKTAVRLGYSWMVDQPLTNVVIGTSANPPLATPLTVTGSIPLNDAIGRARASGLAPQTVDHGFRNAQVQTYNINIERELFRALSLTAGYFGTKGTHLRLSRNINQPVNGVRPVPRLSAQSPILPGVQLGNITQVESTGNSSYNALWAVVNSRLDRGPQLHASYTWSKSIDYNSSFTVPIVVQNSYDLRNSRGLSDFDARHRFVMTAIYELPFRGNQLVEGWEFAAIVQAQSGNPVNIVTSSAAVNGIPNTVRPNVNGPVGILGTVERWFDTSVFQAVNDFGSLGRNVLIGPGFNNTDVSVVKTFELGRGTRLQFRSEVFDVFNHANFGQPGNVVGSQTFGRITNTRFPTGDSGSSRQMQFAVKFVF